MSHGRRRGNGEFRSPRNYLYSKPGRTCERCSVRKMRGWLAVNMPICIASRKHSTGCYPSVAQLQDCGGVLATSCAHFNEELRLSRAQEALGSWSRPKELTSPSGSS
jgi:hypothetical protein